MKKHIFNFFRIVRYFSTSKFTDLKVTSVHLTQLSNTKHQCLKLEFKTSQRSIQLPLVWLKDHCRSPQSYNWETNQRRSNATKLFNSACIKDYKFDPERQSLLIKWESGQESDFRVTDLVNWSTKKPSISSPYTLWNSSIMSEVPSISNKCFDFVEFAQTFVEYGVLKVTDIDASNEKATKKLCENIAPIHNTFYGYFWVFGVQAKEEQVDDKHQDTAYGNEEIGPHTDGTYFEQTPGIQVFHCLKPAEVGGDTVLVDGFHAAEKLRQEHPEYFEILNTPIEHHYLEGMSDVEDKDTSNNSDVKLYTRTIDPVIKVFDGKIIQIRFNPYDRAPFKFANIDSNSTPEKSALDIIKFYEAYEKFSQLIHEPTAAIKVSLKPGTVIFIDNYRVFHARTEFKGSRKMCGCYLSRDNFLAKVRPILKIDDL